jgi:abequosyltransferase
MTRPVTLSVAIPSYRRPKELGYLLQTIDRGTESPDEIVVCDDNSPDSGMIEQIVSGWLARFESRGTRLRFIRNEENLGYDRNLRELIRQCTSDYVVFIGNDDAFLPTGIHSIYRALETGSPTRAYSRSFAKFSESLEHISGISRFADRDRLFDIGNSRPRMYLRLCAYFGGLVFDRRWALAQETGAYDGTLYYQLHLFATAYYESGVGYIHEPTVAARTDGIPLFGSAGPEAAAHSPGGYTAKARARMWADILRIARDVDARYESDSAEDLFHELKTRFSFHVFEGYTRRSVAELLDLARELHRLGLMAHPVPIGLFLAVLILRQRSALLFAASRRLYQR